MHRYCYSELIMKVCFLSVMEIFISYSSKVNITLIVLEQIFTEVGKQTLQNTLMYTHKQ